MPRRVWVGASVRALLDGPPDAPPGVGLVGEAGNDVKVRVGDLLASRGTNVPADRVAVGVPALVYRAPRGNQEVVHGGPLLAPLQFEGGPPVHQRDDDATAGQDVLAGKKAVRGVQAEVVLYAEL